MNSKKIKKILLSLTISTLLVIFLYSLYISSNLYSKYKNTKIAQKTISLSLILSGLVNDLQNERMQSFEYQKSNGNIGKFSLEKYTNITNKRLERLDEFIINNSFFELDIYTNKVDMSILQVARNIVLKSSHSIITSDELYEKLNGNILSAMSLFSLSTKDEELKKHMFSLALILNIIKKTTNENSLISSIIEKDYFTLKEDKLIRKLTFEQEKLFKLFEKSSLPEEVVEMSKIEKNSNFLDVKYMKKKILKENIGFSIKLDDWQISIVNKTLLLTTYKEVLSKQTKDIAQEKINNAVLSFSIVLFISIILIIATLIISNIIIKIITNSVIEQEKLLKVMDENIIFSKTNLKGEITQVSNAFCKITSYAQDELLTQNHSMLADKSSNNVISTEIIEVIANKPFWIGEMRNKRKNGTYYWLNTRVSKDYDLENNHIGNIAFHVDITSKKEVEELSLNLEEKIEEKTKDLIKEKSFIQILLDSQEQFILTIIDNKIKSCNKSFLNFFNIEHLDMFDKKDLNIFEIFDVMKSKYLEEKNIAQEDYLKHVINNSHELSKVKIKLNNMVHMFSISARYLPNKDNSIIIVFNDITEMEFTKEKIFSMYKHTNESIEFATHIQRAIIPSAYTIKTFFKDYFAYWEPKDLVGGDIYLFESLRHKDECLLFIIDCTGHGVPGAFLTMLIKAIQEEIVSDIKNNPNEIVCTSRVLSKMNKKMKYLLKDDESSNVGFDGAIVYYDKISQILKYSGANINLHYFNENEEFIKIKANRYSAGYKSCDENYEYKQNIIKTTAGMKFYLSTDGYIDQNGGHKSFPFGNKKYSSLIKDIYKLPMKEQKAIFQETIKSYEKESKIDERNDDITLFAFEIMQTEEKDEILLYEGIIRENIINDFINMIEKKIDDITLLSKVSSVVLKLTQKIMKYSKALNSSDISSFGLIEVFKNSDNYLIKSENIISLDDKKIINERLGDIANLDINTIVKKYEDLRKNQKNNKKIGLAYYEIASISDLINTSFVKINDDKFLYTFNIIIKI